MRVYIVTYLSSVIEVYSCAVDATQTVRRLRRIGNDGAVVCEARLNAETNTGHALLSTGSTATSEA